MDNYKVSVVMMTSFSGQSFKGPQMPEIINELENRGRLAKSYGLYSDSDKVVYSSSVRKKLRSNRILKILFKFNEILCNFLHVEIRYYLNERIFGFFAMIHHYDGDVVLLKPRPAFLVKYFKKKGKKTIIEASENYSFFTYDQIRKECATYNIPLVKSIFTNMICVKDYADGIKKSDALICLSEFSAKTYRDYGYERNINIIGLETKMNKKLITESKSNEIIFTSVANHSFLKGTHRLLEIWKKYNIRNKLYVIGRIHDDLKDVVDIDSLPKNIQFTGSLSRTDVANMYQNNDCVNILMSVSESYGRTIYEAFCSSTPVIVTPTCTCDLVKDRENGFIVSHSNEDIYKALATFINMSKEEYLTYRLKAYDAIIEKKQPFGKRYVDAL